ncbi:hypothetical protein Tco_1177032 [Tanacetum coccineum]
MKFGVSSWHGSRIDGRSCLLSGAIDGSEGNRIIRDSKLEFREFSFYLVPLSYGSVDVRVGNETKEDARSESRFGLVRHRVYDVLERQEVVERLLTLQGEISSNGKTCCGNSDSVVLCKDLEAGLEKGEGDCLYVADKLKVLIKECHVLMPRVVKSRDEIFSRWGYCDNRGLSRKYVNLRPIQRFQNGIPCYGSVCFALVNMHRFIRMKFNLSVLGFNPVVYSKRSNIERVQLSPFAKTYHSFPRGYFQHDLVSYLKLKGFLSYVSIALLTIMGGLDAALDLNDFLSRLLDDLWASELTISNFSPADR